MKFDWRAFVLPAVLVGLAEIGARADGSSDSIAPPSEVLVALGGAIADGSLIAATRDTLASAFGGLAIGGAIGLVFGILLGSVDALNRLMEVTLELVRPIPSVALAPVALVALGFGYRLEIAIVAYASLWPVLLLTRSAVAGVEPRLIEVAQALRLSFLDRVVKIVVPAALPRIFVAFRLAAGFALIVAVTIEIAINPLGLGAGMMTAGQALRPELMLAYLVWIGIVGFALNLALVFAQQRLFGRAALVGEAP
jgi:NitT/TauT family transport system permease protein